jgi:hypothetical protein
LARRETGISNSSIADAHFQQLKPEVFILKRYQDIEKDGTPVLVVQDTPGCGAQAWQDPAEFLTKK